MSGRLRASVIVIGDEILDGYVRDTNSGWLARRLTAQGVPLDRIVTVPDQVPAIGEALRAELGRPRPRLVLTSGGIGSTPDDRTMEAVATCLGRQLVIEPSIDARLSDLVHGAADRVDSQQEEALRKMALVPHGGYVIQGASGVAPGIAVDVEGGCGADGGATVIVLPGIPSELRRITTDGIEPHLLVGRGDPPHVLEVEHPYPESTLSPLLARLVDDYPDVAVGSYPGRRCVVRLKGPRAEVEQAMTDVRARLEELSGDPVAQRASAAWQTRWT